MPVCNNPLISIVIPVHNQSVYTRACLESLAVYPPPVPYEIVVVDDGSTDDTPSLLLAAGRIERRLRSIRNDTPLGFAGACNRGAAAAEAAFLLFLNNDTEVLEGWLAPLLEILQTIPDIGIVGPKLIFPDRTIQHCGKVWSDLSVPHAHPHHIYYQFPADHPAVNKDRDYQLLTGACMLVRKAEFLSLGGFDELYENGWEDDDLCYKYTSIGKRLFYCAASEIVHHQNKTLNERLDALGGLLPSEENLALLDKALQAAAATPGDIELAQRVQRVYGEMELELARFRQKFEHNRSRFFAKWGKLVKRDDYLYCAADGVPLDAALKGMNLMEPSIDSLESEAPPLVSIVILTLNRLDVTDACLASIRRNTPESHEIIFVDNGSTDGTLDWLRRTVAESHRYRLIDNGTNLGFAKGCNQGIEASRGSYILLLNNDTIVTPEWLSGLLECCREETVGIVGPMTNNISGIQQWPQTTYSSLSELDGFAREFRLQNRYRRIPSRRIVGFCMLFRRSLIAQVGILDEQFGSGNFEDDDYCLRTVLEGYTNVIAGDVFIHHVGSATFQGNGIDYREAILANQTLFNRKWSRPVTDELLAGKIVRLKAAEKAELLCQKGETNQAVEVLLQEGIRQLPDELAFYHRLTEIFLDAGMPKDALDILKEAPRQDRYTILLMAKTYLALGNIEAAREMVATSLAEEPLYAELWALNGAVHAACGDFGGAASMFERTLAIDPGSAEGYAGLADLAESAGDRFLSMDLRVKAFVIKPWHVGFAKVLHATATNRDEYERVERLFSEARHFLPDNVTLAYLHIDLLLKMENYRVAMDSIEDILVRFKTDEGFIAAALAVRSKLGPLLVDSTRFRQGMAVSLCMIVKNEEKNLPRCLASLKPIVDEMIIVDTGSSDRTKEIAEIFGASVIDVPWTGDYSAARNVSLTAAHGNWILVMDADEVISNVDYAKFTALIAQHAGQELAFTITTRNYTNKVDVEKWQPNRGEYPNEESGAGWMPSDKVRLFTNRPDVHFENAIHEMVESTLDRLGVQYPLADVIVHHYGYLDDDRQKNKSELYYELGKQKLMETGGDPKAICELAIQAGGVGRYDEAIELWHKALTYDPNSYLAYFNLGYAYLQEGLFREGRASSLKAMELHGNYREAVINYAICELCLGQDTIALQAVTEALSNNRDYPTLLLMRGVIYACQGDEAKALRDFRDLRDNNVEFSQFIYNAVLKLMQGKQTSFAGNIVRLAVHYEVCDHETAALLAKTEGLC